VVGLDACPQGIQARQGEIDIELVDLRGDLGDLGLPRGRACSRA
jgi:hypothetical protein